MDQDEAKTQPGYLKRVLIEADQGANVVLLDGQPDETISARSYRLRAQPFWGMMQRTLDLAFFWQRNHCQQCYEWEMARKDLPAEYQKATDGTNQ